MKHIDLGESHYQNLYHSTSVVNAINILRSNVLLGKTKHLIDSRPVFGVSTSRNRSFKWHDVTFRLDAVKIRYRNKIIPVDFLSHSAHYNVKPRDNAEDFVMGDINGLSEKIISVKISTVGQRNPHFDDLYDALLQTGIEVELL